MKGPEGSRRPEERLRALELTVQRLERQVAELLAGARRPESGIGGEKTDGVEPVTGGERPLGGVGRTLATASIVCLVLVVALALRMLADRGVVAAATGAAIGVGYCGALLAAGGLWLARGRMAGNVLAASGGALCLLIVVENHHRYGALSLPAALAILGGLALAAALLAVTAGARGAAGFAFVGSLLLAPVLDLPDVRFAWLAVWLWSAQVVSFALAYGAGWRRMRWPSLLVTAGTLVAWTALRHAEGAGAPRLAGFPEALAAFGGLAAAVAVWRGARKEKLDAFEAALPTIGVAVPVGLGVWAGGVETAAFGALAALLLGAFAAWRLARGARETRVVGAFLLPAALLATGALPAALPVVGFAAPVLALLAVVLFGLSHRHGTRTPRTLAYLLQAAALGVLLAGATGVREGVGDVALVAAALVVAVAGLLQYARGRTTPASPVGFPARGDPRDRLGVLTLAAGSIAAFVVLREIGRPLLAAGGDPGGAHAFQAWQTAAGAGLIGAGLFVALRNGLPEVLAVALAALAVLAAKVVLYDLFVLSGPPAIVSVLSLAAVAGGASVGLQRRRGATAGRGTGGG